MSVSANSHTCGCRSLRTADDRPSLDAASHRAQAYAQLFPQLQTMLANENDTIANLANVAALLKESFDFHWVGFYRVVGNELVLGPFQGPAACTRIARGRGVCGSAWQARSTIVVPDVDRFPGHIACSVEVRSEIVIPYFDRHHFVAGVLDIDSDKPDDFQAVDQLWLEKIAALLR
jgi:GAF domain-containing protein